MPLTASGRAGARRISIGRLGSAASHLQRRAGRWLLALGLAGLAACLWRPQAGALGASSIAGKAAWASVGVGGSRALTDGIAAEPGDDWEIDLVAPFAGPDASVTYDLGAVVPVRAIWLQADHNDDYRVMISEDGAVFEKLWDAPQVEAPGLRDRSTSDLKGRGRYLRLEPLGGDGLYGVAELAVWQEVPAVFPPEVPRRRGTPLEVEVRTQLLLFAAAAIAALVFAYRGAAWWWLLGCALLPLWAGVEALEAVVRAWPVEQRQVSMLRAVCAAIAAAAVLREVASPPRFPPQRAIITASFGVSALLAMLAFYNLGEPQFWDSEHDRPTPVHLLDLRQYYGTVKYFDELGYRGAFDADVAAYIEDTPGVTLDSLSDAPMRDLDTHRMSTVGQERAKIEAIKQRFSPERWQEYKADARYLRKVMGADEYLRYMFDFAGNATPVWIGIVHLLFNSSPASMTLFSLTGLLDPLLFLVTFAAIWRCFGFRTMAVVMVVFGANDFIMYGTNWGGATLRHDWLMYIGLGACALERERWALGGFFLALSAMIRAFPAITLVSAAFPALWWIHERRREAGRWPRLSELRAAHAPILRVLGSALATALVLLVVTSWRWSLPAWADWLTKVGRLAADSHGNSIALRGLIAGWQKGHAQLIQARWSLFVAGLAFFVGMVALSCRQKSLERAAMAGLILIPVVFYPANYYIHIVCFLPLLAVERGSRGRSETSRPETSPETTAPLAVADAGVWLIVLGLCVAQYWTVLVTDRGLHFHLATVLLFGALTALVVLMVRADVREGRLDFLVRFMGWSPPDASPAAVSPAAVSPAAISADARPSTEAAPVLPAAEPLGQGERRSRA